MVQSEQHVIYRLMASEPADNSKICMWVLTGYTPQTAKSANKIGNCSYMYMGNQGTIKQACSASST